MKYSNPRTQVTIENWPSGTQRVTANFFIESDPKRGDMKFSQEAVFNSDPRYPELLGLFK